MDLEEALNSRLPPHKVVQCVSADETVYQVEIAGYPQCTGVGNTPAEALRVARHLFIQLRDAQTAVAVTDLEAQRAAKLREAVRLLVARALG